MTKTFLNEGDSIEVKGSGKNPYLLRKIGSVVDCNCPAWRNVGGQIDLRVCKHIRANVDRACLLPHGHAMYDSKKAKPAAVKKDTAPPCLLAHKYSEYDEPIAGRWMSVKLDGVRAWWTGDRFLSRLGNEFFAPQWFKDLMPKGVALDGELFAGRGNFHKAISAVRKKVPNDAEWQGITYVVFDAPERSGVYEDRIEYLKTLYPTWRDTSKGACVRILGHVKCKSVAHMVSFLEKEEAKGGEGIMLRAAESLYEEGKSWTLLKVKSFFDDEGIVTKHVPGRGRHKGRLGAVMIDWNGVEFKAGTGFTDKQRNSPPSIGSKVTFRYEELTHKGKPRNPRFIAARDYE